MALGSCHQCIKYLMFAFNFLFWEPLDKNNVDDKQPDPLPLDVCDITEPQGDSDHVEGNHSDGVCSLLGCAILGVGIWLRVDQDVAQYVNKSDEVNLFYTLAYILIAVGIVIMIIGFLGCCGAIRESQCMLGMFFVCLFVIFAILLGAGIWAVVAKDSFKELTGVMLDDAVKNYYKDDHAKNFMDTIQGGFKCCGSYQGGIDYLSSGEIPSSCGKFISTPCNDKFYAFMSEYLMIVAGIAIGIAVILILGMIFSMVLCCAIRDSA